MIWVWFAVAFSIALVLFGFALGIINSKMTTIELRLENLKWAFESIPDTALNIGGLSVSRDQYIAVLMKDLRTRRPDWYAEEIGMKGEYDAKAGTFTPVTFPETKNPGDELPGGPKLTVKW